MACIIDLEGSADWHPRNKQDVSRRLALWALRNQYDQPGVVASGPLFKSMSVEGARIRIRFDHVGAGLMTGSKTGSAPVRPAPGETVRNFAIAGADQKWVSARAEIEGSDLVVYSPEVPEPVAVRYAFCQDPAGCNLYNREGLPAVPFRTDFW
jgi:sialate O-acetylesterase